MQLEQRFALPAAPAQVWAAFRNVPLLVECLPGASLTGAEADGAWPLRFDAKLGPIAAGFVGKGRASFDDAARTGRFEGSAADARTQSRVKGAASFRVETEGETSMVVVGVDYTLTGSLAQFSRGGIVRELANALTAQFAERLAARLPQGSVEAPAASAIPGPRSTTDAVADDVQATSFGEEANAGSLNRPATQAGGDLSPTRIALHEGPAVASTSSLTRIAPHAVPAGASAPNAPLDAGSLLGIVLRARWRRFIDWLRRRRAAT